MKKTTGELLQILNGINKESELNQFAEDNLVGLEPNTIPQFLEKMIDKYQKNKSQIIEASCIPRTYAYQIFKGIRKPGRDKLLAMCLAIGLNLQESQQALCLSSLGGLYPKKKRDAIIIFAINKGLSVMETNDLLYEMNESILV